MCENAGSILIIGRDDFIPASNRQALRTFGYQIQLAEDGESGLREITELQPDMALLDLDALGIAKLELLQEIVDAYPDIVVLTSISNATVASAVEAIRAGAYDLLPKPFTPAELRTSLERGMERRGRILDADILRQEKHRMKEDFVSMVSHELRSPVSTVLQYFEVLLGGVVGEIAPEQERILRRMQVRMQELLSVIRDWLDMAQIDKGKLVRKFYGMDLKPVILETLDFMNQDIKARNITIHTDFGDELPKVRGEKRTLKLVFSNLIGNAVKYNMEGGTVSVVAREDESSVMVEISDTGVGIAEQDLPCIFDEFYRIQTIETEGTGLGLAIVKKIVEAHSGTVTVSSELGKGSTFLVSLPREQK